MLVNGGKPEAEPAVMNFRCNFNFVSRLTGIVIRRHYWSAKRPLFLGKEPQGNVEIFTFRQELTFGLSADCLDCIGKVRMF